MQFKNAELNYSKLNKHSANQVGDFFLRVFSASDGDPAFYSKVGFQSIDEARLRSPMPLSMPQGWIAQSLTEQPLPLLTNKPNCVQQFVKPDLW